MAGRGGPVTHGHAGRVGVSSTYNSWKMMIQRCKNPKFPCYYSYGGRGITVHERWLTFANFLSDMKEKPTPKHTIDRINTYKGYEPGNCRWATRKEQSRNSRSNRVITYYGKTQTLAEWAEELGMSDRTLASRLNRCGWSVRRALTTPVNHNKGQWRKGLK